jgi:hypothetical protein
MYLPACIHVCICIIDLPVDKKKVRVRDSRCCLSEFTDFVMNKYHK